jgi:hypothetical protein
MFPGIMESSNPQNLLVQRHESIPELLQVVKLSRMRSMPDESERLKKLEGDFAKALEVIQYLVTRDEGILLTREHSKRAKETLGQLVKDYEVPPERPFR